MGEKFKRRFDEEGYEIKGEEGVKTSLIDWDDPRTGADEHRHEGVAHDGETKDIFSVFRKNKK